MVNGESQESFQDLWFVKDDLTLKMSQWSRLIDLYVVLNLHYGSVVCIMFVSDHVMSRRFKTKPLYT